MHAKPLRKLKKSEILGVFLWATETKDDCPGLMFYMSKHEACLCFCWSPQFKSIGSRSAIALTSWCSAFAHPCSHTVFHPRPLCWLWHPACPALTEDKDPLSQSSFSQVNFQHQCPGWSYSSTDVGHHPVPWGCIASTSPSSGDVKTHHSSGVTGMMDPKMEKIWSSDEEVLYAYFEPITTKANKISEVVDNAKLIRAPVHQHKKGMINEKEVHFLLGKEHVSFHI